MSESAWPYLLQFWRYRGKSRLGGILPSPPSCRDKVNTVLRGMNSESVKSTNAN